MANKNTKVAQRLGLGGASADRVPHTFERLRSDLAALPAHWKYGGDHEQVAWGRTEP